MKYMLRLREIFLNWWARHFVFILSETKNQKAYYKEHFFSTLYGTYGPNEPR